MLTLFAMPTSSAIISDAQGVVTAWVPEFMALVGLVVGIAVFVGTIMLLRKKIGGAVAKIFGVRRGRGRGRRR